MKNHAQNKHALELALVISFLALVGYGGYRYLELAAIYKQTRLELASTTAAFVQRVESLQVELASSTDDRVKLGELLKVEQGKNDYFDFQLKSITNTVGQLDKLSKTDPQLLQKYSKVYFLNENYVPASLTDISSSPFAFTKDKPLRIHSSVWPYLQALLQSAAASGIELRVLSGYRSFGEQGALKSNYRITYGTGANRFSADQGYSEHQLGTTVDFTTPEIGSNLSEIEDTPAYKYLSEHAFRFGFILSYPKGNSYYQFEPWHWRYVGIPLATKLYQEKKNFYDLDQREINEYLISIFD